MSTGKVTVRVLIVEDSLVSRELLKHIIESDDRLEVTGTAATGEDALRAVRENRPDIIIMDLNLPGMDGQETTRRIMDTAAVPVIIVSASITPAAVQESFDALDSGAVAVLEKPKGPGHPDYEHDSAKLVQTIKEMAAVPVGYREPGTW